MPGDHQTIANYRILKELAHGASGIVYLAEHAHFENRIVAIKLLHNAYLRSEKDRNSFLQEASFLDRLKHPHILPIYDVGMHEGFPYIVAEYAPNGSLKERLEEASPNPLPLEEALRILSQIGQALHYAHERNIIHRDVKPANILFNTTGDALLADFSIAIQLEATGTQRADPSGTPFYMAPEQFEGIISKKSDQYALACIAYELLTGQRPFSASEWHVLAFKHMSQVPTPPTELNPQVPPHVEQAILKAMTKDRSERYEDIAAFIAALDVQLPDMETLPQENLSVSETNIPTLLTANVLDLPTTPLEDTPHLPDIVLPPASERPSQPVLPVVPVSEPIPVAQIGQLHIPGEVLDGPTAITDGSDHFPTLSVSQDELPTLILTHEAALVPAEADHSQDNLPTLAASVTTPLPSDTKDAATTPVRQSDPVTPIPGVLQMQHEVPVPAGKQPEHEEGKSIAAGASLILNGPIHNEDTISNLDLHLIPPAGFPPPPPQSPPMNNAKRKRRPWIIAATAALILLLIGGGVIYALPRLSKSTSTPRVSTSHTNQPGSVSPNSAPPDVAPGTALVNITTAKKNLAKTYTIAEVAGTPNASNQVSGARFLSTTTGRQSQTVSATGQGTTSGVQATGTFLVGNGFADPLTISAGLFFSDTHGIQVVTTSSAVVPPGTPSNLSTATVSARAVVAGTSGNIPQKDIATSCCMNSKSEYLVLVNYAFTGGQNGQSYTFVQQSDLYRASGGLIASLTQQAQASLSAQLQANEQLVNTPSCSPSVSYNQSVGARVSSVTATVSVSCRSEAYNPQNALPLAASLFQNDASASKQPYTLSGNPVTSVLSVQGINSQGTVTLLVQATGTEIFQFSNDYKQTLLLLIVGKSEQDARRLLLSKTGVQNVSITLSKNSGSLLPTQTKQITIKIS